jgi:peptide/nickel transport system permease protein
MILFMIFDTDKFKKQIAIAELGGFAVSALDDQSYQNWLAEKGLAVPFYERYVDWVGNVFGGDFGHSFEKDTDIGPLLADRLINTGILGFWVFALMIPISLVTGVLAGMKEGSAQDRTITFISVFTTSIPEIATAILLTVVLALGLGWLPAKSAMIGGFDWRQLVLPVLTLVIYDFGYVARMTRASMCRSTSATPTGSATCLAAISATRSRRTGRSARSWPTA